MRSSHCTILVLARGVLHAGRCTFLSVIANLLRPALSFYHSTTPLYHSLPVVAVATAYVLR